MTDEFVRAVHDHAERMLRPAALRTDREGVTAEQIADLRAVGLLTHRSLGRDADRRVHELLAGACFNTWLVWAQHAALAQRLTTAGGPLPDLARQARAGEILLGAGVSDVRSYPRRYIAATRTGGGWTFSGTISWVSGWGLSPALTVAAVEPASETVVTALVEVGQRTRVTAPLHLAAVAGSRTERVSLDDVFVPDEHVLTRQSLEQTRFDDLATASDARGHHFGLAATVLRELDETLDPPVRAVAAAWQPRVAALRRTAYGLADEAAAAGGGTHRLQERLATKAAVGEALTTLTQALLVARAGRGLAGDDTAQLHARSALFALVQGQSADVRRTQLARLADRSDPR
ncbi:acyl-CoA/acyl-ACP dehydrogenase [Dactylosporangium vinaceum]|uniref:Acyl-CoA dehydrogenase n=1 Tax=Dactylosporangium vinaceum TaxID=53362 RepID=A0ABV5M345_9ACTN|nr:acyl-CoA dehydrogenase family protein [Dactylosporangium vinaceum]UAB99818.1 acyl-CoA/acyl-ACP dehydrogenase [Dactylosporangium vinaceum]